MRTFVKEMKHVISTDFTVGILGGGQLGKMLLDVTRRWDIHTRVLDANADASARNSCNQFVQGSLMDYETVVQFGNDADVLTIEIEHVNIDALYELEKRGVLVFPKPATLDVIQNKRTQKEFYTAQKLPTAPYMAFANKAELDKATAKGTIKFPCIWKAARFGYDGFGVKKLDNIAAIDTLPEGDKNLWTLVTFKYKRHFKAEHGLHGSKSRSTGADGKDLIIPVPLGTLVFDSETGERIAEITSEEDVIVAPGGMGGRGNWHFKSPTNQAPRYAQPGKEGVERGITFELKVLADVGLVGFPNAGESTLLAALTSAKPKIADYPFTTLKPNLGIVQHRDFTSFVMADIPGIIEGAAEGKGLGHYFLRHIERNSVLLYVIPADTTDIKKQFTILNNELTRYNPELLDKNFMIGISKADLLDQELYVAIEAECKAAFENIPFVLFSSVSQQGIATLKDTLWHMLNE